MDDALTEFLGESGEQVEALAVELIALEKAPDDSTRIDTIFRLLHTIKGTCRFFALKRLEAVAHAAEGVLSRRRDGVLAMSHEDVTVILAAVDRINDIRVELAASGTEGEGDDSALILRLAELAARSTGEQQPAGETPAIRDRAVLRKTLQAPQPINQGRENVMSKHEPTRAAAPQERPIANEELVTMRVGGQLFGVPVLSVQHVLKPTALTRVPVAPPAIIGLLNLRGRVVTALDLRIRLGMPPREPDVTAMAVVVEHQHEHYSLIVDEVGDVLSLSGQQRDRSPANLDTAWREVAAGLYRLENELLVVLDISRIVGGETTLTAA